MVVQRLVDAGGHQVGLPHLGFQCNAVDGHVRVGDAALVIAAILQVIDAVGVLQHVTLMGMALEHQIHVAVGQRNIVVRVQLRCRGGAGLALAIAVVDDVDDEVGALLTQAVGLGLNQGGQVGANLEVDVVDLVRRNGGIAIANGADDAHLHAGAIQHHGRVAVRDAGVGIAVINVDGQEGELGDFCIRLQITLAPVKIVVAHRRGGKLQLVHPIGDDGAVGQIGLGTTLPHIARRQ